MHEAAEAATTRLERGGLQPLQVTTPHTLRRTYISIALLANGFDVKWVMSQVGHADSKMTMDVYAQLEQRADRSHGTDFDRRALRLSLWAAPRRQPGERPGLGCSPTQAARRGRRPIVLTSSGGAPVRTERARADLTWRVGMRVSARSAASPRASCGRAGGCRRYAS